MLVDVQYPGISETYEIPKDINTRLDLSLKVRGVQKKPPKVASSGRSHFGACL